MTIATRDDDKFTLRLPAGMRPAIKAAAKAAGRSMNAEIIHRLEAYGPPDRIVIEVDTAPIETAIAACERLTVAADTAFAACERLGIRKAAA